MALIKCKGCGQMVSDKGTKCPKCGTPITKTVTTLPEEKEGKTASELGSSPNSISQEGSTPVSMTASTDNNRKSQRSKKRIIVGICVLLAISAIAGGIRIVYDELGGQKAFKEIYEAAENGNRDAQYKWGVWSYHGDRYVKKNRDEAIKWLLKAAEQKHELAIHQLGFFYYDMEKYDEAVKWFRKSADLGNSEAQCYLGYCYEKGYGIDQNYKEALYWYRKAAEQGNKEATQRLEKNGEALQEEISAVEFAEEAEAEPSEEDVKKYVYNSYLDVIGVYKNSQYFLYDITGDKIPELWVLDGSYEADYKYRVYTYINEVGEMGIGDIPAGHSTFFDCSDYLLKWYAHGGYAEWVKLSYNGAFQEITVYTEENVEEYKRPKGKEIETYSTDNAEPLRCILE